MRKLLIALIICMFAMPALAWEEWQSSARGVVLDTTNFGTNLSSTDTTVQIAMDTIDELAGTGDLLANGSVPLTADWDAGDSSFDITAVEFKGSVILGDDEPINFGAGTDSIFQWETQGNDNFQIGVRAAGDASNSGYISIMDTLDMGNANRSPLANSVNPVLRIYSNDVSAATDYIEFSHDQTDGVIASGSGDITLDAATSINLDTVEGDIWLAKSGTDCIEFRMNVGQEQFLIGVNDAIGSQVIIGEQTTADFAHANQTNPTLFIHSGTTPGVTDEWISFTHDVTDGVIAVGSGNIRFDSNMALADAKTILIDTIPASDETQTGIISSQTMGTTVAHGDVVYQAVADSRFEFGDADAAVSSFGLVMALGAGTDGNPTDVLHYGVVRQDTDWNWTLELPIYLTVTGTTTNTLSQVAPVGSGDQVVVIGYPLTADSMFFNPSMVLVEVAP